MIKYSDRVTQRRKDLFNSQFRVMVHEGEEAMWWEVEGGGHIMSAAKIRSSE